MASAGRARLPSSGGLRLSSLALQRPRRLPSRSHIANISSSAKNADQHTAGPSSSTTSSSSSHLSPLAPGLLPGSVPPALPSRIKPASPAYYTGKPAYVDTLVSLEDLAKRTKRALEQSAIPFEAQAAAANVNAARRSLAWLKMDDLSNRLGISLKSGQYRSIISRLSALAGYRYFVQKYLAEGRCGPVNVQLAAEVERTLQSFNRYAGESLSHLNQEHHASFLSGSSGVDALGRAYARGRRKESSARVWLVPSQHTTPNAEEGHDHLAAMSNSILINSQSISAYFSRVSDREIITFPLRLTGLAGVFNIFALVRGGGTTGQTGAVAHGIARALVTYFDSQARKVEDVEGLSSPEALPLREQASNIRKLLARSGILRRDRRMVERKKTGKAKARKAYTWVKR